MKPKPLTVRSTGATPDPDRARRLWRSAPGTNGLERISLAYADFPPNGEAVQAVAEQLHDALGVRVVPRALSYEEYVRMLAAQGHELLYALTPAAYDDPSSMLLPLGTGGFLAAAAGLHDRKFDGLLALAEAEFDPVRRLAAYGRAEERVMEMMPVVPLLRMRARYLCKQHLHGVALNRAGTFAFERFRVLAPRSAPVEN